MRKNIFLQLIIFMPILVSLHCKQQDADSSSQGVDGGIEISTFYRDTSALTMKEIEIIPGVPSADQLNRIKSLIGDLKKEGMIDALAILPYKKLRFISNDKGTQIFSHPDKLTLAINMYLVTTVDDVIAAIGEIDFAAIAEDNAFYDTRNSERATRISVANNTKFHITYVDGDKNTLENLIKLLDASAGEKDFQPLLNSEFVFSEAQPTAIISDDEAINLKVVNIRPSEFAQVKTVEEFVAKMKLALVSSPATTVSETAAPTTTPETPAATPAVTPAETPAPAPAAAVAP